METEAGLLNPVAAYFKRKSFGLQEPEMPFYEHRVDLYGFSKRHRRTVAVELKMYKWRRAFEQAILYQLCADFVFIAMPDKSAQRVDRDLLKEHGIGLLGVRDSHACRQIVRAQQSQVVQRSYTRGYIDRLSGRVKCRK